jgi:hypothetical protein
VGKIALSESVVRKAGPLNRLEQTAMRLHTRTSAPTRPASSSSTTASRGMFKTSSGNMHIKSRPTGTSAWRSGTRSPSAIGGSTRSK